MQGLWNVIKEWKRVSSLSKSSAMWKFIEIVDEVDPTWIKHKEIMQLYMDEMKDSKRGSAVVSEQPSILIDRWKIEWSASEISIPSSK